VRPTQYSDPVSEPDDDDRLLSLGQRRREERRAVDEGGGGESEGFELAEEELIEHASHGDDHGTRPITRDAELFAEETAPDPDLYGDGDTEEKGEG
jgi:hypothetical protein